MKEATAPVHVSELVEPIVATTAERAAGLTAEQKAIRAKGIGASEVGALIGVDRYRGPLDVWLEKTGRAEERPESDAIAWGNELEDAIARVYRRRTEDVERLEEGSTMVLDNHPRVVGTPDRIVICQGAPARILQIKAPGYRMAHHWGESGGGPEGVPPSYLVQVQQEMLLTGLPRAHVVALIGGQDYRVFEVDADAELQGMLIEEIERFWRDYVEPDRQPPVDGTEGTRRYLDRQYPRNIAPLKRASAEAHAIAMRLRAARHTMEKAKVQAAEACNQLKELIGENEGLFGEGWRCTWKKPKDSRHVDWEAIARAVLLDRPMELELRIKDNTTLKPGTRRFLPKFDGEDEEE